MTARSARRTRRPLSSVLGPAALLAALVAGCSRPAPPPDPAELIGRADALIAAGDGSGALAALDLLGDNALPAARVLRAEALMTLGRWDDAIAALADAGDDTTTAAVRGDACALGAMAALETQDAPAAARRLEPCAASTRVDLQAARIATDVAAGTDVGEVVIGEAAERLAHMPPSPELDRAAELLERAALARMDAVEGPYAKLRFLSRAFEVGQNPELRERLLEMTMREGEAVVTSDPHTAVSLLEHLTIARVRGLEVPADMRARAETLSRQALFPTFVDGFGARYLTRPLAADDRAAGILSEDGTTLTFRGATEAERAEQARAWVYRAYERPRPTDDVDFLGIYGQCPPAPEPCVLPFAEAVRFIHDLDDLEEALSRQLGRPLNWPRP